MPRFDAPRVIVQPRPARVVVEVRPVPATGPGIPGLALLVLVVLLGLIL